MLSPTSPSRSIRLEDLGDDLIDTGLALVAADTVPLEQRLYGSSDVLIIYSYYVHQLQKRNPKYWRRFIRASCFVWGRLSHGAKQEESRGVMLAQTRRKVLICLICGRMAMCSERDGESKVETLETLAEYCSP